MKHILPIIILVLIVVGIYTLITHLFTGQGVVLEKQPTQYEQVSEERVETGVRTTTPETESFVELLPSETVLGQSTEGRDIIAYHIGSGEKEVVVVGGIHGGYSPNTTALVEELRAQYEIMGAPNGTRLTFIPLLNPDGAMRGDGAKGRFNANNVDINRNFDCEWSETGTWRSQEVSGGDAPFSEPESVAVRDYLLTHNITAVVVYYSSAGEVFASSCSGQTVPATIVLMNTYADASGYTAKEVFDYYAVTGDMTNWLAKEGVPAISVLLTDHVETEFQKNLRGLTAILSEM